MGNLTRKPVQLLLNEVTAKSLKVEGTGASAKLVIENYGVIKLSELRRFFKHTTGANTPKTQILTVKPYYPENGKKSGFEAGFEVKRTQELTGFAQHMLVDIKRYAGLVDRLGSEKDGYINEVDAVDVATQIAAMIRKHEGAIVTAKAQIPVTLTSTENASVTIEAPELKKKLVIAAAGAVDTIAKLKTAIDGSDLEEFVTVDTAGKVIESKYALKITGADKITFGYPKVVLVGKQAVPSFIVKDLDGVATVDSITEVDRSSFTRADVARLFPVKWEHAGTQPLVPIPGVDYCKYRFEMKHDLAYALDGANHIDGYIEQVEFYLPKTAAIADSGANWDQKIYTFLGDSGFNRDELAHS